MRRFPWSRILSHWWGKTRCWYLHTARTSWCSRTLIKLWRSSLFSERFLVWGRAKLRSSHCLRVVSRSWSGSKWLCRLIEILIRLRLIASILSLRNLMILLVNLLWWLVLNEITLLMTTLILIVVGVSCLVILILIRTTSLIILVILISSLRLIVAVLLIWFGLVIVLLRMFLILRIWILLMWLLKSAIPIWFCNCRQCLILIT